MLRFKITVIFMLMGLLALSLSCQQKSNLILVEDGKSHYSIVLSEYASLSEKYAANELQKTIRRISGCTLPLISTGAIPVDHRIYIGSSALTDSLMPRYNPAEWGNEGFIIQTIGNDLFIIGGQKRGTMYGIFTFLEKYLNCRWYTKDVHEIPQQSTIILEPINDRQRPAFEYRMPFYTEALDQTWATHNKINGYGADLPEEVGGKVKYAGGRLGHTFYSLVPPKKYFDDHPEYFSLVKGKRVKDRGQLCLTHPEVLKISIREIERWLKDDPEASIVSITQNDWEDWCECEQCKALDEKEESHSATIVNFVNTIADSFAGKYPNVYFDTFAYTYSQKPPKTLNVRDNVIIRICHMNPCCDAHPLTACERDADYVEHLRTWRTKGGQMYVWHYVTNFSHYLMPLPNFNALKEDIRFYYQEGLTGVFCQGDSHPGGGGEWAELRSYVLAKLLWDPDIDVDAVINDFMQGVYGKAAAPIRQYFDMLHEIVEDPEMHFDLYSHPDEVGYLSPKILKKSHDYFDSAEKLVAGDPETLSRVQKARLPVYYADLWFQGQGQILAQEAVNQKMLSKFKEIVTKNGVIAQSGQSTITSFLQTLSSDWRFIRNLKIIGPFDGPKESLLETKRPPEYEIDYGKQYQGVAGVRVIWQDWTEKDGLYVDFTTAFDPDTLGIAYGLTYIHSPGKFPTQLGIGSNDGVRVYINDALVHDHAALRKATPNSDVINVTFSRGWNKVLVKVDQIGAGWGMYLSVIDPEKILKFSTKKP